MTDTDDPQSEDPTATDAEKFTARLTALTREAGKLGLELRDMLIAVNGVPFAHDKAELPYRLTHLVRGRTALTFRRDGEDFTVIATTPALGAWDPVDAPSDIERRRLSPNVMTNWEIYVHDDGHYDLQPLTPSLVALLAAPFWLAQMRLWVPMATVLSVVIITLPFGFWMTAAVYGVASVYVWRMSQELFRADRIARGFSPYRVIAAPSEKAVHTYCEKSAKDLHYVYAPQQRGIA